MLQNAGLNGRGPDGVPRAQQRRTDTGSGSTGQDVVAVFFLHILRVSVIIARVQKMLAEDFKPEGDGTCGTARRRSSWSGSSTTAWKPSKTRRRRGTSRAVRNAGIGSSGFSRAACPLCARLKPAPEIADVLLIRLKRRGPPGMKPPTSRGRSPRQIGQAMGQPLSPKCRATRCWARSAGAGWGSSIRPGTSGWDGWSP